MLELLARGLRCFSSPLLTRPAPTKMATAVVCEPPRHDLYLNPRRPWLQLLNIYLRPAGRTPAAADQQAAPASLLQQLLPEELLLVVLGHLPAPSIACAACVCRQFARLAVHSPLWEQPALEAFQALGREATVKLLWGSYRGCWRTLYLDQPHLRYDGVYVSRNTYIKLGVKEWDVRNATHLVVYFRYFLFLPGGSFFYRTSPEPLAKVSRSLRLSTAQWARAHAEGVERGRWKLRGDRVLTAMAYSNAADTEVRMGLRLRSTARGAHNRLDLQQLLSYDRACGTTTDLAAPVPAEEEDVQLPGVAGERSHQRGRAPFVFVQWQHCADSPLNLPISKMDFYIPG